jgi:hypothetical protein
MASDAVTELCCTPVLLNKIELAVILGIKVAWVAMRLDKFLELWFLQPGRCYVRKRKEGRQIK